MLVVHIHALELKAVIGVYPQERTEPRPLLAHLDIMLRNVKACHSDMLEDTLDYDKVTALLQDIAGKSRYRLIEALAWEMLEGLAAFPIIAHARIELQKPGCVANTEYMAVRLEKGFS